MATGLNINRVIAVTVTLNPAVAAYRNFGQLMVLGSSPVIGVDERQRTYADLDEVGEDFPNTSPEYLAADLFFSQSPQPSDLLIGRWAQTATPGLLRGGVVAPQQQLLGNFTTITNGGFTVNINGTQQAITGLNFTNALNLNNVASIVQAALPAGCVFKWNSVEGYWVLLSSTTGAASSVGYLAPPAAGTDVSGLFNGLATTGAVPVAGVAPESLLSAVQLLGNSFGNWYGLVVATAVPPMTSDHLAVAAYIEGASRSRIYGITTQDPAVVDPTQATDIASQLMALGYKRTFTQYSTSSPYAVASMYGRAFTVNFDGNNTTITLKFKTEPGVAAELLTETQADALEAKNCNVFVQYDDNIAFIEQGTMANGYFFDEVHGSDWFQNRIQIDALNALIGSPTKVPQTDAGVHMLVAAITGSCIAAVNNGLVAPGVWNAAGFGSLNQGDTLAAGYYVYAPQVASQSEAQRQTRAAPPIQVAATFAGAIHSASVLVNVVR